MGLTSRIAAIVEAIDPRVQHRTRQRVDEVRDAARELRRALDLVDVRTQQLMLIERLNWEQRTELAAVAALLDRARVKAHVIAAIEKAPLVTDPFPHFVVENWLPPAVFDVLLKAIPAPVFFAEKPAHKQQLPVPPPIAPEYSRQVWQFMADVVATECIGPAVVEKLRTHIDGYMRAICPAGADWPAHVAMHVSDGRLIVRRPGYLLEPHRDPRWGFVTCLAYLTHTGSGETYGTHLYRVHHDGEAPDESVYYVEKANCELVRTVPPIPNTLLVFLNSAGAHGASIPPDAPGDLERFIYQFRIGPDLKGIRWLLDRMPDDRRALWAGLKTDRAGY